jgi:hypothetical protein
MIMGYQQDWVKRERKFFLWSALFLAIVFLIAMVQNVIRYGMSDTYNPLRSITYLMISLVLFIGFLPTILQVARYALDRSSRYFAVSAIAITITSILCFYVISATLMYVLGFFDGFFSINYARQYFGREALFHILLVIGTCGYVYYTYQKKSEKLVKGSVGRKSVTIPAQMIRWIEADDHYLKLYTEDSQLIKRSTLEKMADELEPDFVRIHRKYLVNTHHIQGKEKEQRDECLLLSCGNRLKVGRSYQPFNIEPYLNKKSKS